jgi:diguanylate cyclase (GGDEF)-like protein
MPPPDLPYRRLLEAAPDGILVVTRAKVVTFVNAAGAAALGCTRAELEGSKLELPLVDRERRTIVATGKQVEMRVRDVDWQGRPASLVLLREVRDSGAPGGGAPAELLEQVRLYDPLTGTLNRRGLERALAGEISRRQRTEGHVTVLLLHLDDMAQLRQTEGDAVGDAVLEGVADRLRATLRSSDHVARVGDRFVVLLPETRFAEGMLVAHKLRRSIRASPVVLAPKATSTSASVGVTELPSESCTFDQVLVMARAALAQSQAAQRPEGDAPAGGRRRTGRISKLLERGEGLIPYAQDIIRLPEEQLVAVELLSRGPGGGLEKPLDIFRVAQDRDMLTHVDISCLRICAEAAAALEGVRQFHFNIFPSTLLQTSVAELLELLQAPFSRGQVCLEISERQLISTPIDLVERTTALRRRGLQIAVQDVGFGRSSLEALILLAPDFVKAERSYVTGVADDMRKAMCMRRLANVASSLKARLMAVGVESPSDFQFLRDLGVQLGQGHLWSKARRVVTREPVADEATVDDAAYDED